MKDQRDENEVALDAQQRERNQAALMFGDKSDQEKADMKKKYYKNVMELRRKSTMKRK